MLFVCFFNSNFSGFLRKEGGEKGTVVCGEGILVVWGSIKRVDDLSLRAEISLQSSCGRIKGSFTLVNNAR